MARWEVLTRGGSVQVEGGNWLLALGVALPTLGLEPDILARLVCDVQSDGVVRIVDPVSRTPFLVRRLADEQRLDGARAVMPVGVVASGGPAGPEVEDEPEPVVDVSEDEDEVLVDPTAPPPERLAMPTPTASSYAEELAEEPPEQAGAPHLEDTRTFDPDLLDAPEPGLVPPPPPAVPAARPRPAAHESYSPAVPETGPASFTDEHLRTLDDIEPVLSGDDVEAGAQPPEDLEETLFMRGMDVADAGSARGAAETALAILEDLIPAESSSVLYAGINDTALRFLAAHGPSADKLDDIEVPLGSGIAGFCFDNGSALIVRDAAHDPRHLHEVDQATGYRTRDMLSVALRDSAGGIHGCIQLLNPQTGRFEPWHLEAASTVGSTLADFLLSQGA